MKMNHDEFMQRVRESLPYEFNGDTDELVNTVLQALRHYITDGEWDDVKSVMPKELANAMP